jgi:ubiquinol-cytochrome c reductase iron-sulfur subunit
LAAQSSAALPSGQTTGQDDGHSRRDFLTIMASGWALVVGATALWPMLAQLAPDASTVAAGVPIEVDVGPIKEGQAITVLWRGKPIFVRHRTKAEIAVARAVPLSELKDQNAENPSLPGGTDAEDKNRVLSGKDQWLVLVGICTHLGCIPLGQADGDKRGDYGGWFCPCHGSQYDTSGRIRKGPAPRNLEVPPYAFLTDTKIKIG